MLFIEKITANTQRTPDKLALQFLDPPDQRITYGELETGGRLAQLLVARIRKIIISIVNIYL